MVLLPRKKQKAGEERELELPAGLSFGSILTGNRLEYYIVSFPSLVLSVGADRPDNITVSQLLVPVIMASNILWKVFPVGNETVRIILGGLQKN